MQRILALVKRFRQEFSFIKGNYAILVLSWVLMDLASEMPTPNYQYYVQALGGTGIELGLIGFCSFMALAAVQFPGGYLADRYGRRWLISTMTFALALCFLFYALAPTWHFILIGAVLMNLCLIYQPALWAMISDSLPPERRGMGFSIIMLINSVVTTPGPLFAGILLWQFGLIPSMRIVYIIVTALYLAAAFLRLRLKETITSGDPIRPQEFLSSYPKAIRESWRAWKVVPRSMFWLFISQTISMFAIALVQVIQALYARDVLLIPESIWWLAYIPLFLSMLAVSIPIGKFVDRVGRRTPLLLSIVLLAPTILIFMYGDFTEVLISMSLLGVSILLGMSAGSAMQTDLVAKENRGKIIGFTNFVGYIAVAVGMLLGNWLYVSVSPQLPFFTLLVLLIPQFAITLLLIPEPRKREEQ
jgi:MFS family permease